MGMSKFRFGLSVVLTSACAVLAAGIPSAASGAGGHVAVAAHVYVNDNTGG
jgi:hypothetical protein